MIIIGILGAFELNKWNENRKAEELEIKLLKQISLAIQKDNIRVIAVDISQFKCLEVDFEEDLNNANKLFPE